MNLSIYIKRIYEPVSRDDGFRILIDRLWPRGIKKSDTRIDHWLKEIAPSTALRKSFNHNVEKWEEFQKNYEEELKENISVSIMFELIKLRKVVTLLYAANDDSHNHAIVLKKFLEQRMSEHG